MKNKSIIFLFILAIAIRLFLMYSCYHPDLAGQSLSVYFWGFKNVTNIYDHLLSLSSNHPLVKNFGVSDIFIYPPLTYFTLGTFQKLFSFTGLQNFLEILMSGFNVYLIPNLRLYLTILKLPYLFIDMVVAFLLYNCFTKKRDKNIALIFWLFNPVTLYSTFAMGVFDIIPVLFTVLTYFFYIRKKFTYSFLSLGFGIAFKMYPIFLLPFLVFKSSPNFLKRVKYTLIAFLPIILTNLPYLSSSAYKFMVFSPKSQKMFYMQWMLSGAEGIFPFILFSVLLYLFSQNIKFSKIGLSTFFLSFFLLLFSVTHFHPQWFIWITPFIIIELINNNFKESWLFLIIFIIYIFIVFTFENSLSVGLFAPLNPLLAQFKGTANIMSQYFDTNQLKSYARSLLAGISAYLTMSYFYKKNV